MIIERPAFERRIAASLERTHPRRAGSVRHGPHLSFAPRAPARRQPDAVSRLLRRGDDAGKLPGRRSPGEPSGRAATYRTGDIGSRRVRRARRLLRRCGERRPATRHVPHRRGARRPDVRELPGAATCRASSARGSRRATRSSSSRRALRRARTAGSATRRRGSRSSTCRRSTRRRSSRSRYSSTAGGATGRSGLPRPWPRSAQAVPATYLVVESLSTMNSAIDPVAAVAALFAPAGRLTARCRGSYEFRLQRARGYGALKAILSILAAHEPQNLTEIAQHLHRTPGSTKDYLSWLEDVDLVTCRSKRARSRIRCSACMSGSTAGPCHRPTTRSCVKCRPMRRRACLRRRPVRHRNPPS